MTNKKVPILDKCIYVFLVIAFAVTIILVFLGAHTRYVPNSDSITARVNRLPITINDDISITSSKNDAGKHASLRWFEKVEVRNINSDWVTASLNYYCSQQDMVNYIVNLNGSITIRFVTRNDQQFNIEKILKQISFTPSTQCKK